MPRLEPPVGRTPWILPPPTLTDGQVRLFCFPYAGGSASIYRAWSNYAAPNIEVCPVQLPGRANRQNEPLFTTLDHLVETLAIVLQPYVGTRFAFFGHSLGGLIAFELAREFRRRGGPNPTHLFMSGIRAPQRLGAPALPFEGNDDLFIEQLHRLEGTPTELLQQPEILRLYLPVLRADFAMAESYRYKEEAALVQPISAFGGQEDRVATADDLSAWREHTQSTFSLRMFPERHFFLRTHHAEIMQTISNTLS